jgi:hypothetical protein
VENKLSSFNQILPRLDPRRGLINPGGQALKMIFGTETISDIHELHNIFDNLQPKNADIVHSLDNQLTCVKKLDTVAAVNTDSIMNLSSITKSENRTLVSIILQSVFGGIPAPNLS